MFNDELRIVSYIPVAKSMGFTTTPHNLIISITLNIVK